MQLLLLFLLLRLEHQPCPVSPPGPLDDLGSHASPDVVKFLMKKMQSRMSGRVVRNVDASQEVLDSNPDSWIALPSYLNRSNWLSHCYRR